MNKKDKCTETNLIYQNRKNDDDIDMTHFDVEDYLMNPDNRENYFIGSSSK